MEETTNTRELTFKRLGKILVKGLWIIALVAVIVTMGFFVLFKATFKPKYRSTASIYILNNEKPDDLVETNNQYVLAMKLVDECKYIITSNVVLGKVIDEFNNKGLNNKLKITRNGLKRAISIESPENTRFLEVSVSLSDATAAADLANILSEVSKNEIANRMQLKDVSILEPAEKSEKPFNKKGMGTYILIAIVTALCTYIVLVIKYVVDDRVRTEDDITSRYGLSILGNIPNAEDVVKNKKGYMKYYRGYAPKLSDEEIAKSKEEDNEQ